MDYSVFKGLQFVLFFGVAFAFGFWQLYSLRRDEEKDAEKQRHDKSL